MVTVALLVLFEAKPCQERWMHVCGGERSIRMQDRIRIQRIRI
jgi:hypothetical protein